MEKKAHIATISRRVRVSGFYSLPLWKKTQLRVFRATYPAGKEDKWQAQSVGMGHILGEHGFPITTCNR
jgi:hypothetical protein